MLKNTRKSQLAFERENNVLSIFRDLFGRVNKHVDKVVLVDIIYFAFDNVPQKSLLTKQRGHGLRESLPLMD